MEQQGKKERQRDRSSPATERNHQARLSPRVKGGVRKIQVKDVAFVEVLSSALTDRNERFVNLFHREFCEIYFTRSFCGRDINIPEGVPLKQQVMAKYARVLMKNMKLFGQRVGANVCPEIHILPCTIDDYEGRGPLVRFLRRGTNIFLDRMKLCVIKCCLDIVFIFAFCNSKTIILIYGLILEPLLKTFKPAISTKEWNKFKKASESANLKIRDRSQDLTGAAQRISFRLSRLIQALQPNTHQESINISVCSPSRLHRGNKHHLPSPSNVVVCTASTSHRVGPITPPAASLMIIERMVTSFDPETNSAYLAEITPPGVLSALVRAPRKDHLDEVASLALILAKSMCFDGKCRRYISQISHTTTLVSLLSSNQERAASAALEFFNELLKTPRSSAISLLEEMRKQGSSSNLCALFLLAQNSTPEYRVLAANVLLQLEVFEDTSAKSTYGEEAAEALFEALQREEFPQTQALSSFILANLGGTFSWTGEAYTMAWLVRKTGLNLSQHKNMIKTYDFLDQSLQDGGVDSWCSKIAQRILQLGTRVFEALDKGLKSKIRRVARESLVATAWLGLELMKGHDELRHAACEILLHSIEQFVHPGFELEERLLACLCIYNYTSGRGMKRIMSLSEGVRESLRRLSNVTWMAEELLKVADYFQPNKWRISCVHSQILEAGTKCSAAVTALIYYKGYLCSGYADGSIKAWEVKGQTVTLVLERKEHRKAVTCLGLYDPGSCLLSGSPDKTIKMWQMKQRNLECIEVIPTKESIRSIDSLGELIFVTTQSHKLKVIDGSRKARDVVKNKNVKCMRVAQGKVYAGCVDSSILEVMISNNRQQEIKGPSKGWMQNKPIRNAFVSFSDVLVCMNGDEFGLRIELWQTGVKRALTLAALSGAAIVDLTLIWLSLYILFSFPTIIIGSIVFRHKQERKRKGTGEQRFLDFLAFFEPILLEVDQIYHLACPASPVHYKYNPVKTIISLQSLVFVAFLL
ncbi:hypothetical protein SASPL_112381 [Salvia splendens]|uniref:Putative E3 ubiquitin-protein ligase LIN ARM-like domain-containing protein n=1 Tax=Salvia splendens TaxID=180675 RepID=A0A8X9A382_SALSN|nr:hypothetical protein SASPL_112381 [Salvia splendens]